MKKLIFIMFFTLFCFANEPQGNDSFDDFDSEFSSKTEEVFDPLSGYNRAMTSFNDGFYSYVLTPVSKGYATVMPKPARTGINNFFTNLMFPVRFLNNLLQFKFQNASEEVGRFFINTIWGIAGFMDPATDVIGMKLHKADFGQTLGKWGVGDGFPVVLPFLGPSNLRDMVGLTGDLIVLPTSQLGHNTFDYKIPQNNLQEFAIDTLYTVNEYSFHPDFYETIKKDALDLYPYLRDIYKQKRTKEIEE
ncbi:VacJ family lipoprotein [Arcobacter sp. CECT 9188]|uniref:MlaA family lipoprotein n=1 Tax=Arcobacter sp. CECT 9188 TaxID=2044505 RepID=UPI000DE86A40|nr:VacJ family lipoprotein [Arcobacter sp. CECT 9188]RBQ26304.1 ABC transporter [Arcobacter sp. CECT 9188]